MVSKVFLETSVFIRYFTKDDEKKFKDCLKLLETIEDGKLRPYTSNVVIFEILFVLTRLYRFSKEEALDGIEKILSIRNLTLLERTKTKEAIKLFEKYGVKYPDCLIATQMPKGITLATYDQDFSKIGQILAKTPEELF